MIELEKRRSRLSLISPRTQQRPTRGSLGGESQSTVPMHHSQREEKDWKARRCFRLACNRSVTQHLVFPTMWRVLTWDWGRRANCSRSLCTSLRARDDVLPPEQVSMATRMHWETPSAKLCAYSQSALDEHSTVPGDALSLVQTPATERGGQRGGHSGSVVLTR